MDKGIETRDENMPDSGEKHDFWSDVKIPMRFRKISSGITFTNLDINQAKKVKKNENIQRG